jgi:PAS domain S-box-containing protein
MPFHDPSKPAVRREMPSLEAYFANIVELSEDAIISVRLDQRIRLFNQGAEAIFGYTEAEVLGQGLEMLLPERFRAGHQAHAARFAASGERLRPMNARQTIYGRRRDGSEFPAEATITQFTVQGETVLTVRLRDITERQQAEAALRRAHGQLEERVIERTAALRTTVRDLQAEVQKRTAAEAQLRHLSIEFTLTEQRERQRIAQVLHDNLQQLLVAAQFRTSLVGRNPDLATLQDHTEKLRGLLQQAITASRSLTAELTPPPLQTEGLVPALEWLAQWMQDTHGLTVNLQVKAGNQPETEALKVLLFQAVRELLFNVVKHSGMREAAVAVTRTDELTHVVVTDTGQGFDPAHPQTTKIGGLGLASIRQRLEFLGGSFAIASAPGQGSQFTLTVPLRAGSSAP